MKHVWNFAKVIYFPLSNEDTHVESQKGTKAFSLMEKANSGGRLSKEEKEWICRETMNATRVKNQVCVNGWAYDFRPFMKRYLINYYGHWEEKYAFSKKELQKVMSCYKGEIVEAPNRHKI